MAKGVSADGKVVVGLSETASGVVRPFRWTASEGMQDIGPPDNSNAIAYGVSADGSTVVGHTSSPGGSSFRAFRWRSDTGLELLGLLPGYNAGSVVVASSADGSVLAGYAVYPRGWLRAIRWSEEEGIQSLGSLAGTAPSSQSASTCVSLDGRYVAGWTYVAASSDGAGHRAGFLWTPEGGMVSLGGLPEVRLSFERSVANAVSSDGMVVAGKVRTAGGTWHAGRWVFGEGWTDLASTSPLASEALAISANGEVVVGNLVVDSPDLVHAFRWTPERGLEDLNVPYASLLQGVVLQSAEAISADGRFIVGRALVSGSTYQGFLLDTGESLSAEIRGIAHLEGFLGDPAALAGTLELRHPGHSDVIQQYTVTFDGLGRFDLTTPLNGIWDISLHVPRFLKRTICKVPVFGRVQLSLSLLSGDIDSDNEVTLFDFGRLVAAFGSNPGDRNWDGMADLDGDQEITLYDFALLVRNFGRTGDE